MITFRARIRRGQLLPNNQIQASRDLSTFPKDIEVDVFVQKAGVTRSKDQNDRHWAVIVPAFPNLGWDVLSKLAEVEGISTKDSAHKVIMRWFLDPMKYPVGDGTFIEFWPSSSKFLTVAQFAQMDERAERYLNSLDPPVYLPAKEQDDPH